MFCCLFHRISSMLVSLRFRLVYRKITRTSPVELAAVGTSRDALCIVIMPRCAFDMLMCITESAAAIQLDRDSRNWCDAVFL